MVSFFLHFAFIQIGVKSNSERERFGYIRKLLPARFEPRFEPISSKALGPLCGGDMLYGASQRSVI